MTRLVELLRDTDAPIAALEAIARRTDRQFVDLLLHELKHPVPLRAVHNMKRVRSVAWLEAQRNMLLDLDGRAQAVAIELAVASAIDRAALFDLLALLISDGLAEGRRAACQALARFPEPEADLLILAALDDPDSSVQAAALRQLRPRRLPDALKLLVDSLDAPSLEVRGAARSSLAEFNFTRFRAMFDLLDEKAAHSTGVLVHKIDPSACGSLLVELASPSVAARRRAIEMAIAMEATQGVCDQLIAMTKDENPAVRQDAVAALAYCNGSTVVEALEIAANDPNHTLREAARQSLAKMNADPSDPPAAAVSAIGGGS